MHDQRYDLTKRPGARLYSVDLPYIDKFAGKRATPQMSLNQQDLVLAARYVFDAISLAQVRNS